MTKAIDFTCQFNAEDLRIMIRDYDGFIAETINEMVSDLVDELAHYSTVSVKSGSRANLRRKLTLYMRQLNASGWLKSSNGVISVRSSSEREGLLRAGVHKRDLMIPDGIGVSQARKRREIINRRHYGLAST